MDALTVSVAGNVLMAIVSFFSLRSRRKYVAAARAQAQVTGAILHEASRKFGAEKVKRVVYLATNDIERKLTASVTGENLRKEAAK